VNDNQITKFAKIFPCHNFALYGKYLLFGFAGFSESFSDVAQNITSATYKEVSGWVGGWMRWGGWGGRWAKVTLQTQWDQPLCQRSQALSQSYQHSTGS